MIETDFCSKHERGSKEKTNISLKSLKPYDDLHVLREKFLIFTSSLSSHKKTHSTKTTPKKRQKARIQLEINLHKSSLRKTVQQQKYERFWLKGNLKKKTSMHHFFLSRES